MFMHTDDNKKTEHVSTLQTPMVQCLSGRGRQYDHERHPCARDKAIHVWSSRYLRERKAGWRRWGRTDLLDVGAADTRGRV